MPKKSNHIYGLVDADLLAKGTRHPNLALLKIAGYFRDHNIRYELIIDDNADISKYHKIYVSKVFTFSSLPSFFNRARNEMTKAQFKVKFKCGGTGWYATEEDTAKFIRERESDMSRLENDPNLPGIDMKRQMPAYDLYNTYIEEQLKHGKKRKYFKDYLDYSIGFLTRGCFRQCPFCVNRLESRVLPYSDLDDFNNPDKPYIYLWDDNFLGCSSWSILLEKLKSMKKPFQFRQGLDMRLMTHEKALALSSSKYHGDWIFAFDKWADREIIEQKLRIWKHYCPQKTTKFYLFCGFHVTPEGTNDLYRDILILFKRIEILMRFGCLGYVMRHENYKQHELSNIYVQIARWCNQPQFYKKMSFVEFVNRNQTYQEEKTGNRNICKTIRTYHAFIENMPNEYATDFDRLFNMKFEQMIDPALWADE